MNKSDLYLLRRFAFVLEFFMGTTVVLQLLFNRIFWKHFAGVQRLDGIYTGRSSLIIGRVFIVIVYMCYFNVYVYVFKHLQGKEFCRASCTPDCLEILDSGATKYQVKLKESMFINWEKPDLNQQVKHINLTLSL